MQQSRNVLPTVLFLVRDCNKNYQLVRGLWDSCATINLITDACVKRLGLRTFSNRHSFTTAGGRSSNAHGSVHLTIRSRDKSYVRSAEASVVDMITPTLKPVSVNNVLLQNKFLADNLIFKNQG